MTVDSALSQIKPITRIIGIALVLSAALKMFGVHIGIAGDAQTLALVGIGLLHV